MTPNVRILALSPTEILLRWSAARSPGLEIGGYEITYTIVEAGRGGPGPATFLAHIPDLEGSKKVVKLPGTTHSHAFRDLLSNTEYEFVIRACNIAGFGPSERASLRTPGMGNEGHTGLFS